MKVSFYTQKPVSFYGINDAINRIKSQIQNGTPGLNNLGGDRFTPSSQGDSTIIIEHYHEADKLKNGGTGNAIAEGAISGGTAGSAIQGTKAVANKVKGNKDSVKEVKDEIDTDSNSFLDLTDQEDDFELETDKSMETLDTEPETDLEAEIDSEIDSEIDVDIEPEIEIEVPEFDIDLEPEIDINL